MKILEKKCEGKTTDPAQCEDELVITEHFLAVIDGITAKSSRQIAGQAAGRAASETIGRCIRTLPADIAMETAIESMSSAVSEYCEANHYNPESAAERPAASVLLYSRFRREIWSIGDCQCIINGVRHLYAKPLDELIAKARALYLEVETITGKPLGELLSKDPARDYIMPLIKRGAVFQNYPNDHMYAYAVIDGQPVKKERVAVEKVAVGQMVVLASDGYPVLYETLAESEAYLRKILEQDPLCFRLYQTTKGLQGGNKSFDDRTYVRFEV